MAGAHERELHGWGGGGTSRCRVLRADSAEEVEYAMIAAGRFGRGVIARGAGRSYGDAAQNDGGLVIDTSPMRRVVSIDTERMQITAQAGATVAELMARLAVHELTLPVLPGTRHVTLAGAIASDIHGKNHHRDGALARHVVEIRLCTAAGELLDVSPASDPGLFYATLGGMGLTGVVVRATLQAERLAAPWVSADLDRTHGLEETLSLMSGGEGHRYSVAWLDLLAGGSAFGRGIVSRADWLPARALSPRERRLAGSSGAYPGSLLKRPAFAVPRGLPGGLLFPAAMGVLNEVRWRSAPRRERGRPLGLVPYFFPLDTLGSWNRLYGPGGFIQYQFVVPVGQEQALERCFELIRTRRLPVYMAVFKQMGPSFGGPLSFPLEGWTLAVDIPSSATGLEAALEELDAILAGCGGRVYLTKDSRLPRQALAAMYPDLPRFLAERERIDPDGVLRSDLARRLGLCAGGR